MLAMGKTLVVLACCLALQGCDERGDIPRVSGAPDHAVTFTGADGEARLEVWVADSADEQARGLMGISELHEDRGMAFVYDEPSTSSFWMKDTLIPLSIAFVDDGGTIVAIREMPPCDADPCPTYGAGGPYRMAIEANAGYFDRVGIGVGDRARLTETASG
jgi:uncharacterized membrane protein (UPF0127 family)